MSISQCNRFFNSVASFIKRNEKPVALGVAACAFGASTIAGMATAAAYAGYKWSASRSVTQVQPPYVALLSVPSAELLQPFASKIKYLEKDPFVLGIAAVKDKSGSIVPVYVKMSQSQRFKSGHIFILHLLRNDEGIAWAETYSAVDENKRSLVPRKKIPYPGYDGDQVGQIVIEGLYNKSEGKYKHGGTVLIKAIIQYYKEKYEARISLGASYNSHTFYYKLGFRAEKEEVNLVLEKASLRRGADTSNLHQVAMHLPLRARQEWLAEIENNPIRMAFV